MNPYQTTPGSTDEPVLFTPNGSDQAEVRRHFSKLGLAYLVMTVTFMAVAYIGQFAVLYLAPSLMSEWWFNWVVSLVPLYIVGLPVLWLCLRRVPTSSHNLDYTLKGETSEKTPFGVKSWLILLVIGFGCMTAGGLLGNFIMAFLSAFMQYDYAFALNSMVVDTPVWFTFICTCVCAPFGEELIFRKLLIDRTRRYGDLPAILISGLLFGLFHGNLFQFFYAALLGMVLAYVYTRSGRYLPCVAMHAAINFVGSIVTPALSSRFVEYMQTDLMNEQVMTELITDVRFLLALLGYLVVMLWQYGMLTAGVVLFAVFFRKRKFSRGSSPLGDSGRYDVALVNPGMIACLTVMLLLVLINLIPIG